MTDFLEMRYRQSNKSGEDEVIYWVRQVRFVDVVR